MRNLSPWSFYSLSSNEEALQTCPLFWPQRTQTLMACSSLILLLKTAAASSNTHTWSSTLISRTSCYPSAHALRLCASACLEGKRLSCRKWENELRGRAVRTKWMDLQSCRLWRWEHNTSTRFCFWGGSQVPHAIWPLMKLSLQT